jgi:molecular chaperone GrpE
MVKKLELEEKIVELEEKLRQEEEKVLRTNAEMINFKRRLEEESLRAFKYMNEPVMKRLLPIVDNFERALKMDDNNLEDEVSKFLVGFKMIYSDMIGLLEEFEVSEIKSLNETFDPNLHEAIMTDKDNQKETGIVLDVLQKGYKLKDKVIRPSMVKVNE